MSMYEVGTVTGAANQAKVTGVTTKWSQTALGVQQGSILVVYRSGSADLYAIKSVDSDTQLTLTRNITTAFSGASYGIITSETASTSAFANQLASAFSLWRGVVEGWSAALTGSGNITLTDPITGNSVTVPAIKGMASVAGGNNFTGTQSVDSDDSGIILGKNGDIGLVKKNGTWGKLMVGKSTRFSLVKSANDRIAATDAQTEIFGISSSGNVDVTGKLNVLNGDVNTRSIELIASTPYIDFHYGSSSSDYTARIIQDASGQLSLEGANWRVAKDIRCAGAVVGTGEVSVGRQAPSSVTNGQIISASPLKSLILGRGANGDSRGAYAQFYIEEYVGYEHRAVIYLDGYGSQRAWTFRSDGSMEAQSFYCLGMRVRSWSAVGSGYLECIVDGTARGVNFFDSDERLKENIQDVKDGSASDIIRKIRPVSFKYKNTEHVVGKEYSFGVIAQEVEKIIPDLVNTHSDGGKALDPLAAIGLLLAANKELMDRVDELEKRFSK